MEEQNRLYLEILNSSKSLKLPDRDKTILCKLAPSTTIQLS